jgi:glycosyltransferase involved in cell wall biosynthesis
MLERDQAGVHVAERTPESLARALIELADDPVRVARLKSGARSASRAFASADVYGEFRARLHSVIDGSRRPPYVSG